MDLSQLGYEKADGNRIISNEPVSNGVSSHSGGIDISNDEAYSKADAYRSVNILFIISGGEDRESKYFEPMRRNPILKKHIRVSFETKKNQGYPPSEMAEIARVYSANNEFVISDTGEKFQLLPEDTIYLIQDIDEFEDVIINEMIKGLPANSRWIISNPCFEIWLYYHYFKSPMPHLNDVPEERAQRGRWMKRKNNQLVKGGIPTMEVLYYIKDAISNSKNNYSESNGIPSLFSTQMHCLAEDVMGIIEADRFETATKVHYAERTAAALKYSKFSK